jgi:hypothetical protein
MKNNVALLCKPLINLLLLFSHSNFIYKYMYPLLINSSSYIPQSISSLKVSLFASHTNLFGLHIVFHYLNSKVIVKISRVCVFNFYLSIFVFGVKTSAQSNFWVLIMLHILRCQKQVQCPVCKLIRYIHKESIPVTWKKPKNRWTKLNFDGSCKGTSGKASIGGVVRNHKAEFFG